MPGSEANITSGDRPVTLNKDSLEKYPLKNSPKQIKKMVNHSFISLCLTIYGQGKRWFV